MIEVSEYEKQKNIVEGMIKSFNENNGDMVLLKSTRFTSVMLLDEINTNSKLYSYNELKYLTHLYNRLIEGIDKKMDLLNPVKRDPS